MLEQEFVSLCNVKGVKIRNIEYGIKLSKEFIIDNKINFSFYSKDNKKESINYLVYKYFKDSELLNSFLDSMWNKLPLNIIIGFVGNNPEVYFEFLDKENKITYGYSYDEYESSINEYKSLYSTDVIKNSIEIINNKFDTNLEKDTFYLGWIKNESIYYFVTQVDMCKVKDNFIKICKKVNKSLDTKWFNNFSKLTNFGYKIIDDDIVINIYASK